MVLGNFKYVPKSHAPWVMSVLLPFLPDMKYEINQGCAFENKEHKGCAWTFHMHLLNITKHISSPLNILNMYLNFTIDFIRVHEFIKYLNIIDYIDRGPTNIFMWNPVYFRYGFGLIDIKHV